MELSFVIKALQRRWWIIVLFSLLGALPGSLLPEDTTGFKSEAALLISRPSTSNTIFNGDPERYVQGQLAVLESISLADEVARVLGDETSSTIRKNTEFTQVADTDVVVVSSIADSPTRAKAVVDAFVEAYVAGQRSRAQESQAPDIEAFDSRLRAIEEELAQINAAIEDAMRVYVINAASSPVPPIDAIAPAEQARRLLLIDEANQVQTAKNDFELLARLRVNTEVVQTASLPTEPVSESNSALIIGGYVLGAMVGVVVALIWAQFSPYLIDEVSLAETTGQAVVGRLSRSRTLRVNPLLASQHARGRTKQTLAQVAVRSEALGSVDRPLVIACVGTRVGAGATTTSLAVAGRFAQQGSLVTIIDADDRDRSLSKLHADPDVGGLAELVAAIERGDDIEADSVLSPTELPSVNVIGQLDEMSVLRRANVEGVLQTAAQFGDVLIVDGGPLLGSAAVIEACRHADAIVLAVPLQKQLRAQLEDVVHQLGPDRQKLLTVANEPISDSWLSRIRDKG